jgi:hypothetical protein
MAKKPVSLYLESAYVEEAKRRGLNLSELVNDFLEAYLSGGQEVRQIRLQIAQLQEKLRETIKREFLEWKLSQHITYYKQMEAKNWRGHPELKQKFLEDTAKKFGLTPGEVLAICEGARPSKEAEAEGK